jgi:hypothetical protein
MERNSLGERRLKMDKESTKREYKNVFKVFFIWQESSEEGWLRKMSNEGWHLNKTGFFNYEFVKGEPKDVIYKFDYKPFRNKRIDDYISLFEEAGWEYVGSFTGWFYFRTEAKKDHNQELYNDNTSKLKKYRTIRWAFIIVCVLILLTILFSTPLTGFLFLILIFLIYGIIRISRIIKRIKSDIVE